MEILKTDWFSNRLELSKGTKSYIRMRKLLRKVKIINIFR
jgi:hypothetical protein